MFSVDLSCRSASVASGQQPAMRQSWSVIELSTGPHEWRCGRRRLRGGSDVLLLLFCSDIDRSRRDGLFPLLLLSPVSALSPTVNVSFEGLRESQPRRRSSAVSSPFVVRNTVDASSVAVWIRRMLCSLWDLIRRHLLFGVLK